MISKTLEQINLVAKLAKENVEDGPTDTITARRGRKRQAVDRLNILRDQYFQDLMRSAVFILVTGTGAEAFAETAKTGFGCFTPDVEGLYKDLAARVAPVLYLNKHTVANMFDVLGRHLEDKALELGVLGYPQLIFKQKYARTISSKEEFQALVTEAINDEIGGELAGIHAVKSILDEAIDRGFDGKIAPIVLTCRSPQLAIDLAPALERLSPRVFVVAAGKAPKFVKTYNGTVVVKEPTPEGVETALTTIKNSLKK